MFHSLTLVSVKHKRRTFKLGVDVCVECEFKETEYGVRRDHIKATLLEEVLFSFIQNLFEIMCYVNALPQTFELFLQRVRLTTWP